MTDIVAELIVSLDGHVRGEQSPGYYGYFGPELGAWFEQKDAEPHRTAFGRKTYEILSDLPEEAKDEDWHRMVKTSGWLFSRTLSTSEWPNLTVVGADPVDMLRRAKEDGGPEIRILGSLSIVHQLLGAEALDRLRLIVCPLVLPQTGLEPLFAGLPDLAFDLESTRVLDDRVLLLDYRPAGPPPSTA
ncbi:dihydrofolate reductase family protein [Georgenia halophila]|uniref:Dihydrofolate reductase family protein n=1 Tax=Georgenia halophila TaxID=620889 RepID=A0ABP8LLB1_9MICO